MAATSGALTGFAEAAEKEDEKREDITKIALAQRIKNIENAREIQKEQQKSRKEQDQFVDTFAGKFAFFNEETNKLEPLSEAQALEIYTLSSGDTSKAVELIQKNDIRFKGQGKVQNLAPITTLDPLDDTLAALDDAQDGGGLFSKGRYKSVSDAVSKQVKLLGGDTAMEAPQLRSAIGTGIQLAQRKDPKIHMAGRFTYKTENGEPVTAEGIVYTDGSRAMYDGKGNLVSVPTDSKFEKYTTKTETPKERDAVYFDVAKNLETDSFKKSLEKVRGAQIGLENLAETYDQMLPLASDLATYSLFAQGVGTLLEAGEREIAGIRFVFTGNESATERDSANTIAQIDSYINANIGAKDVKIRAEVLEAMQVRAAYAFLQAEGDTRPSDADLRRAVEQFKARGPEAFVQKATANWKMATAKAETLYNSYLSHESFTKANRFSDDSYKNSSAFKDWLEDNTLKTPSAELPSFLMPDPNNPDKIIAKENIIPEDEEKKSRTTPNVTLTSSTSEKIDAYYIDGKYYLDVDEDGNPRGTGLTVEDLKKNGIKPSTKK